MIALWYVTFFFNICFIRCLACLFVRRQISPNTRVYLAIVGEFLFILLIGSFIIWPALEAATILIFQVSLKSPFFHFRSDHMHESLDEKRLIRCSASKEQFGWLLTRNLETWAPVIQIKDHVCPPDPILFSPMALYFLSINLSSLSITSHKKKGRCYASDGHGALGKLASPDKRYRQRPGAGRPWFVNFLSFWCPTQTTS